MRVRVCVRVASPPSPRANLWRLGFGSAQTCMVRRTAKILALSPNPDADAGCCWTFSPEAPISRRPSLPPSLAGLVVRIYEDCKPVSKYGGA